MTSIASVRVVKRPRSWRTETYLAQQGLHPLVARLFAARGLTTPPRQQSAQLLPPRGLLGLEAASRRLVEAITRRQPIVVVADYDCDGATACAVAVLGLRRLGASVDYVVPDRFRMGYGLTEAAVDLALQKSPGLIVTVDNGIASVEGVLRAKKHGVDVVITDHHLPGKVLPDAVAIVNPNQPGCSFASKALSGVGVMFYVLLGLRAALREKGVFSVENQPRLDDFLDLVAVGTVADLVKLDENNRLLVSLGLARLRGGQGRPGLQALARVAGREPRQLNTVDMAFSLAPRINAAGRLADMRVGIECLMTSDATQSFDWAVQLDRMNAERRDLQADMHERANVLVDVELSPEQRSIVIVDDDFHLGVVGLVASKLKDKHGLPSLVFAPVDDEYCTGSGRSISGFHLRDAIDLVAKRHPHIISRFGGHAMAAGLTLRREYLDIFRQSFEEVAREWLGLERPGKVLWVDGALETAYIQPEVAQLLEHQVWGQGFETPLFFDEWRVVSQRVLKEKHIKAVLEKEGRQYDAIAFQRVSPLPSKAWMAFRLSSNTWNGMTSAQLIIEQVVDAT